MNNTQRIIYDSWLHESRTVLRRIIKILGENDENRWFGNMRDVESLCGVMQALSQRALSDKEAGDKLGD